MRTLSRILAAASLALACANPTAPAAPAATQDLVGDWTLVVQADPARVYHFTLPGDAATGRLRVDTRLATVTLAGGGTFTGTLDANNFARGQVRDAARVYDAVLTAGFVAY